MLFGVVGRAQVVPVGLRTWLRELPLNSAANFLAPTPNWFLFPTISRTAAPLTNLTIYPLFTANLLSSVVPFYLLWPGYSVSMADAAEAAARKVCHTCGDEKDIDQFRSFRGPRRIVLDCADCRNRGRQQVSLSDLSSLVFLLTSFPESRVERKSFCSCCHNPRTKSRPCASPESHTSRPYRTVSRRWPCRYRYRRNGCCSQ
jgi:hypothetical protein